MKRLLVVSVVLASFPALVAAGDLERDVKNSWLGAWVVANVESYSDCSGMATNNRINGMLVKSRGQHRFQPGELAKIQKIDVKRSRLDVHLWLAEPLLLPYAEGPFTLYREAECRIELEVELPREVVRARDARAVEQRLAQLFERHATEEAAQDSISWNGREREPYPEDYDRTLAELAVWRAEQTNAAVQAKLDQAAEHTTRLADRVSSDSDYLAGFAGGVESARAETFPTCPAMLAAHLEPPRRHYHAPHDPDEVSDAEARRERGHDDGRLLVIGLELMRRLPGCFVPVPQIEAVEVALSD